MKKLKLKKRDWKLIYSLLYRNLEDLASEYEELLTIPNKKQSTLLNKQAEYAEVKQLKDNIYDAIYK